MVEVENAGLSPSKAHRLNKHGGLGPLAVVADVALASAPPSPPASSASEPPPKKNGTRRRNGNGGSDPKATS